MPFIYTYVPLLSSLFTLLNAMKYFRVGGSPPPFFSLRHSPSSCWNIIVSTITIINVFINIIKISITIIDIIISAVTIINVFINIINIAEKDNIIQNIVNTIKTVNNTILPNLLLLFIHSEPLKSICYLDWPGFLNVKLPAWRYSATNI